MFSKVYIKRIIYYCLVGIFNDVAMIQTVISLVRISNLKRVADIKRSKYAH